MRKLMILAALALAACDVPAPATQPPATLPPAGNSSPMPQAQANAAFARVVRTVEPVAEAECARLTRGAHCDYLIQIDPRPDAAPNAFQSLAPDGRPVITFTSTLIAETHNIDELAFVMGHEAAHHIAGHIPRQQRNAVTGALILGGLAALTGLDSSGIEGAQRIGATVGARTYSKEYELEADRLGTIIALRAGYDPLVGARFFTRIPDPGNRFLGSHPPNAARYQTVVNTMAELRG